MWWFDTPQGLVFLFLLAFVVRVLLAPTVAFKGDIELFTEWTMRLRDVGLGDFYTGDLTYQYPPGYLYVLAVVGLATGSPGYLALKLPPMLADLGLAWVVGVFAVRLAPEPVRDRLPVRALAIAAVLFNPALVFVSAVWGQVDVVPTLLAVASLLLLVTGSPTARRELVALLLFAGAFAIKPHSVFLFPAVGYVLFRRHLYLRRGRELAVGAGRVALLGAVALAAWFVSGIPFALGPRDLLDFYRRASEGYQLASVQAFNLWGIVGFARGDVAGSPDAFALLGVPALYVGMTLFVALSAFVLWRAHQAIGQGHDEARVVLVAAALVSLTAYVVLTRMHERYMFPVLAYVAPLVVWRRFCALYAALSTLFLANLWYPLTYFNETRDAAHTLRLEPLFTWLYGDYLAVDPWQRKLWSALVVATFVVFLIRGIRWVEEIDDESRTTQQRSLPRSPPRVPSEPARRRRARIPSRPRAGATPPSC